MAILPKRTSWIGPSHHSGNLITQCLLRTAHSTKEGSLGKKQILGTPGVKAYMDLGRNLGHRALLKPHGPGQAWSMPTQLAGGAPTATVRAGMLTMPQLDAGGLVGTMMAAIVEGEWPL